MRRIIFSIILWLVTSVAYSQCPQHGDATQPKKKQLNIAKNKSVSVSSSRHAQNIPLKMFITGAKHEDSTEFPSGAYISTTGFLVSFEEEGPESCNCGEAKKSLKDGDVHMYLGLVPDAPKKNCIVVEITPAFKKKFPDYEKFLVKNQHVKITGFLLYDFIHRKDAFNTCHSCSGIWRKTCWEIHPVTDITFL